VEGLLPTLDTLSVFVAHFPSRRGGKQMTDAYREKVAQVIRHKVDSIQQCRTEALIVIMGDLNDEVQDASLRETLRVVEATSFSQQTGEDVGRVASLRASSDTVTASNVASTFLVAPQLLYALSPRSEEFPSVEGTYFYQGCWEKIDHIIVSYALLYTTAPLTCCSPFCRILTYPFLLEQDDRTFPSQYRPKRMYKGTYYSGGISDHLPLLLELRFQ
jgi:endonuclease/exonuclease/phosphatase family metal-dependent hydrolase